MTKDEIIVELEKLGIDLVDILGEDFEVWEGFDESKEILELDKLKEYV